MSIGARIIHELGPASIGWGFLVAWGMTGMLMSPQTLDIAELSLIGIVTTTTNIVGYGLFALLSGRGLLRFEIEKRCGSPLVVGAAITMLLWSLGYITLGTAGGLMFVLALLSLALASLAYVVLFVLWARFYTALGAARIESLAVWSTLLCAFVYMAAMLLLPLPPFV